MDSIAPNYQKFGKERTREVRQGVSHIWRETYFRRAHFTCSPAAPGLNGVCGLSLPGAGMAVAGDPRYGPPAIPSRRGCIPFSLVMRLRRDKPFIRGSRASGCFRGSILWRAGRWRCFRPAASRLFESVAEDMLAGTFHDAGSNLQSMLPIEVALHSVRVGLAGANAGRDSFGPVAVRLRNGRRLSGPPVVRESSETAPGSTHAEPPQSRLQPSNTEPGRNAKTQNQLQPKKMGCTSELRKKNSYLWPRAEGHRTRTPTQATSCCRHTPPRRRPSSRSATGTQYHG